MGTIKRFAANLPGRFRAAIGVMVAAIALVPIGWQLYAHWDEVRHYLAAVDVTALCLALGIAVLNLGILACGWLLIAGGLGIALGLTRDLKAFFVSNFAKRVPGMVWYVAGRAYLYRAADGGLWMATTATILENAFLFLTGVLLALIVWPYQLGLPVSWIVAGPLVALALVIVLSLYPTAILRFARLLRRGRGASPSRFPTPRLSPVTALCCLLLYTLVWVMGGLSLHCFVAAFYPSLSPAFLPFTLGVAVVYSLTGFVAFFVPGGLGVKEVSAAYLLSRVMPLPVALVAVLLFRLNLLLAEAIWLALSYSLDRWGTHLPKSKHESTQVRDEV